MSGFDPKRTLANCPLSAHCGHVLLCIEYRKLSAPLVRSCGRGRLMSTNGGKLCYRGFRIITGLWRGAYQASVTPYNSTVTTKTPVNRVLGNSIEDALAKARKMVDEAIGHPRREIRPYKWRVTHCHHCHEMLAVDALECADCGWLICVCEACGCGVR